MMGNSRPPQQINFTEKTEKGGEKRGEREKRAGTRGEESYL
jgi:hypothetical protein